MKVYKMSALIIMIEIKEIHVANFTATRVAKNLCFVVVR